MSNNQKQIVIYKSKYGSSKQYAQWIAKALECKSESIEKVQPEELKSVDVLIYVGGLYAGKVNGFRKMKAILEKLNGKKLLLCMVGNTNPEETQMYEAVYLNNVPEHFRQQVIPFSLRGNQLFSKMSFLHRLMMKMPKAMTEKIPQEKRTEENKQFLENYGKDVFFVEEKNMNQVIEYVRCLH